MKIIILSVCAFFCLFITGCDNGELSKANAKELILQKIKVPYVDSITYFPLTPPVDSFVNAGLIQLKDCDCPDKKCGELTAKGKQYLFRTVSESNCYIYHVVKAADIDFGEIKKILLLNQGNLAEVFYTFNYKVTPFGKTLASIGSYSTYSYKKDTALEQRAIFSKINDKWQVDQVNLRTHPN